MGSSYNAQEMQINLLTEERQIMRAENLQMTRTLWRLIILFITGSTAFLGYYLRGQVQDGATHSYWTLFAGTQVAFVLFLFGVGVWAAQTVYIGYIKALEEKINLLLGEKMIVWETEMAARFTARPYGAFFWTWVVLNLCFVMIMVILYGLLVYSYPSSLTYSVAVVEVVVAIVLLIWARLDLDRASTYAKRLLRL